LVHLDLNTVDTTTLKRVPGIASYRSRQIVRYRDRLGGYASVEQLSEIEGLPVELQAWFKVESGIYRKLKLNSASIGELARHPYIGSARAKAIVSYRRSRGRIQSLSDLILLPDFSQKDFQRLSPYVEY
jgi:DNA uptake protein ComE-like DNA-binding protein